MGLNKSSLKTKRNQRPRKNQLKLNLKISNKNWKTNLRRRSQLKINLLKPKLKNRQKLSSQQQNKRKKKLHQKLQNHWLKLLKRKNQRKKLKLMLNKTRLKKLCPKINLPKLVRNRSKWRKKRKKRNKQNLIKLWPNPLKISILHIITTRKENHWLNWHKMKRKQKKRSQSENQKSKRPWKKSNISTKVLNNKRKYSQSPKTFSMFKLKMVQILQQSTSSNKDWIMQLSMSQALSKEK